jgi:tripartite-type tricarboxylate transporter receptor subunit TctC
MPRVFHHRPHRRSPGGAAVAAGIVAAALLLPPGAAMAETPAEFYQGKRIELDINSSVGGGYDIYARLLARHMTKYIPGNPTIVPKNMEGASGLRLAAYLYSAAPKDGTVLGAASRAMAFEPLLGNAAAQYDGTKFKFIGSANDEVSVCVAWATSGIASWNDVLSKELVVGASGGIGDDTYQFPALLNNLFGAKFRIVGGYPGGNEINLAMERGEVQGRCGIPWSTVKATRRDWIDQKKVNFLMQFSLAKHPDLTTVPLVTDLATTDEQHQILRLIFGRQVMGRPFAVPPGVPADRIEALRNAFMAAMADQELLAEAVQMKLEIKAVPGAEIENLVADIYKTTSPEIARKASQMIR